MRYFLILSLICCTLIIHCIDDPGDPLYTNLHGWIFHVDTIDTAPVITDTVGINGLHLRIYDIDPTNLDSSRLRERTTAEHDSIGGYFEIDSVLYATTQRQGVGYVNIVVDSTQNPGWPSQLWQPSLRDGEDFCTLYIHKD